MIDEGVATNDDDEPIVVKKSVLEPYFLRMVLREEVCNDWFHLSEECWVLMPLGFRVDNAKTK